MESCKIDEHKFKDILTYNLIDQETDIVIRWCSVCGIVHIDEYLDGKFVNPCRSFVPTGK